MKKKSQDIQKILIKYFKDKGYKVNTKTNLIENEILDSIGMFELISFFEKKIRIKVSSKHMNPQNFKTIESILKKLK
jgi:acyl carrier protein